MATKLELECKLLMVEHDIKRESNNETAFIVRANMATDEAAKTQNMETARFYANRKLDAQKEASNLRVAIACAA
jgi:hypothetical protein